MHIYIYEKGGLTMKDIQAYFQIFYSKVNHRQNNQIYMQTTTHARLTVKNSTVKNACSISSLKT
jgi:hypothetical protein